MRAAIPRILGSIGNHPFGTGDGYESRPVNTWSAFIRLRYRLKGAGSVALSPGHLMWPGDNAPVPAQSGPTPEANKSRPGVN